MLKLGDYLSVQAHKPCSISNNAEKEAVGWYPQYFCWLQGTLQRHITSSEAKLNAAPRHDQQALNEMHLLYLNLNFYAP